MKNFKSFIKEDKVKSHLEDFLIHTKDELNLKDLPRIKLESNKDMAAMNKSFGGYSPSIKTIIVNTADRHPADVYRTLAHELVHYKQHMENRLTANAGETGDQFENEANTLAGIIMRNYGRKNPRIYE